MYQINFNKPVKIHFMGIGGISMSGLAEILHAKGFTVVGSDAHESAITDHLASLGIQIAYGQRAENITPDIDVVVYTAAIHRSSAKGWNGLTAAHITLLRCGIGLFPAGNGGKAGKRAAPFLRSYNQR